MTVFHHGIKHGEEFVHAGNGGQFLGLALLERPMIKSADHRITPQRRHRGGRLTKEQSVKIAKTVMGKCSDQLRLPTFLWPLESLGRLIERSSGLHFFGHRIG